jgi:phosphoribosyl-ATP pyrophosphohydrolase
MISKTSAHPRPANMAWVQFEPQMAARRAASCRPWVDRLVAAARATGDKGAIREKDGYDAMFTLDELARTIDQRAGASAETSYTRSLLDKGPAHCARKFGEEAIELAIAAAALDEHAVRAEAADVLYHLLVVLRARGVALSSVLTELERRSSRSGHDEKASRAT